MCTFTKDTRSYIETIKGQPIRLENDFTWIIKFWVGFVYFLNFHIFGIGMDLRTGNNLSEQLFAQILNSGSKGGHANLTVCAHCIDLNSFAVL